MNYSGRVLNVVYGNEDKSYYVLRVRLDDPSDTNVVTVKGKIPRLHIREGVWFAFEADWVQDPKYGRQLDIKKAPFLRGGWNEEAAYNCLLSYTVSRTDLTLLRAYDNPFLKTLEDLDLLRSIVPGSADRIHRIWMDQIQVYQSTQYLYDSGIPPQRIKKIQKTFSDNLSEVLTLDPWRLVEVDGVTMKMCDSIAFQSGIESGPEVYRRTVGAVLSSVKQCVQSGHLYLTALDILDRTWAHDSEISKESILRAIADLRKEGKVKVDREHSDTICVYPAWACDVESESVSLLVKRVSESPLKEDETYKKELAGSQYVAGMSVREAAQCAIDRLLEVTRIRLSPMQMDGVLNAIAEPVSIITGLPGTGKSTSLKLLTTVIGDTSHKILLVAPTGIAAKRMAVATGIPASTIHRALGAGGIEDNEERESVYAGIIGDADVNAFDDIAEGKWACNPENPHPADIVVIDESSMMDQALLHKILQGTKPTCRIVLVGDAAQLPSVGPGNVLREMITSNAFPTVALTEIFRQDGTSDIVRAAHDIYHGITPNYEGSKQFQFVTATDEDEAHRIIVAIAEKLFEARKNFQILSPRHKGMAGVTSLNHNLRERLNPKTVGSQEVKIGSETLRSDDRIMIVRNDYQLGVFNGDVGKIVQFNNVSRKVEIKIHGPPEIHVEIPFDKVASTIRLAYAITVHKSQGLEYDVIVAPILSSFHNQLVRNLYYTAITRAKQKVILVGSRGALDAAVKNDTQDVRNTLLAARVRKACS